MTEKLDVPREGMGISPYIRDFVIETTGHCDVPRTHNEPLVVKRRKMRIHTIPCDKIESAYFLGHPEILALLQDAVENIKPFTRHEEIEAIFRSDSNTEGFETAHFYHDRTFIYFRVVDTLIFVNHEEFFSESITNPGCMLGTHPRVALYLLCMEVIKNQSTQPILGLLGDVTSISPRNSVGMGRCSLLALVELPVPPIGAMHLVRDLYTTISPKNNFMVFRNNPDRWEIPSAVIRENGSFCFNREGLHDLVYPIVIQNAVQVFTADEWDALENKPPTYQSIMDFETGQWVDKRSADDCIGAVKMKLKETLRLFTSTVEKEMDRSVSHRCRMIGILPEKDSPLGRLLDEDVQWKTSSIATMTACCDMIILGIERQKELHSIDVVYHWLNSIDLLSTYYADVEEQHTTHRHPLITELRDELTQKSLAPDLHNGQFTKVTAIMWLLAILDMYLRPDSQEHGYEIMKQFARIIAPGVNINMRHDPASWFNWD